MTVLTLSAFLLAASITQEGAAARTPGPPIGKKVVKFDLKKVQGQLCWGCFG